MSPHRQSSFAMSSNESAFSITVHFQAADLPPDVWASFRKNPYASNIMFAHASKAENLSSTIPQNAGEDIWIVLWDTRGSKASPSMAFILSCTTGPLGRHPIFIYTPLSSASLEHVGTSLWLLAIARALSAIVPPERVFSVFAEDSIADQFAAVWTAVTGIPLAAHPQYYHASLMCCDEKLLQCRSLVDLPGVEVALRPAVSTDVVDVSKLCHAFAAGSVCCLISCRLERYEVTFVPFRSPLCSPMKKLSRRQ